MATGNLDVRPITHGAVPNGWPPINTLKDHPELGTPSDGNAESQLLLGELGQLCLLVSRRRFSSASVSPEQPHLDKYRSWVIAQARNVVVSLASTYRSLDNETILARIEAVVSQLAGTSAAPMANVIRQICRNMGDLMSGRALNDILSEASMKDQETTFAHIEWRTLDIGDNPASQGFENHQYDLVITSNSLRTSANVQSIGHLAKLLKPGGHHIVQEQDAFVQWVTYVFGLRREWWFEKDCGGDKHLAAVGMGNTLSSPVDGKIKNVFTVISIARGSLPKSLPESVTCRKSVAPYNESASMIAEQIITHLKEDGYRVEKCALESQALTGQDIISVESVGSGCATVAVVYHRCGQ